MGIRIRIRILTVSSFLHLSARPPTASATMSIQVKPQASTETPLISLGKGAEIDDVWSTDDVDSEHPMSCGIFTQKKDDEVFSYTYGYHEVKIVLEGIIILEDRSQNSRSRQRLATFSRSRKERRSTSPRRRSAEPSTPASASCVTSKVSVEGGRLFRSWSTSVPESLEGMARTRIYSYSLFSKPWLS